MSSPCSSRSVSVVVATHNEGANLRPTVESLLAGLPRDGEIIIVDDASDDDSAESLDGLYGGVRVLRTEKRLGVSGARNAGVQVARGDILVFSDAHVRAPLYWAEVISETLVPARAGAVAPCIRDMAQPGNRGFGLRWRDPALNVDWLGQVSKDPYAVPIVCGCFFAMRRSVFDAVGGFDPGLTTWGYEDAELSLRLWLHGYECLVSPGVEIAHLFRPAHPYEVPWDAIVHNVLRVAATHFSDRRLERVVQTVARSDAFPAAVTRLVDSDVLERRSALRSTRQRDDDSYFVRFEIDW